MNKQKSQSGFAHLALIIILIVALLGTLGFVFWQNFMQPKTETAKKDSSSVITPAVDNTKIESTIETLKSKNIPLTGGGSVDFKYPVEWTDQNGFPRINRVIDGVNYVISVQANRASDGDYFKGNYGGNGSVIDNYTNSDGTFYILKTADSYVALSTCMPENGNGCSKVLNSGYTLWIMLNSYQDGDQYVRELDFSKASTDIAIDDFVSICKTIKINS